MVQTAKKRRRLLPKNITQRTDSEVAEKLFGKRAKRELDSVTSESIKE